MAVFGSGAIGTGIVINLYDQFTSNANRISNSFNSLDATAQAASQHIEESLNKMKLGFGMMAVGAAISAPFVAATSQAMAYAEGMAKINTTAQLTQEELKGLRKELLDIGANSAEKDISKIPDAFEKIISQTGDTALSLDILKTATKGAQAGFTDIDTVAGALAQSLSIVGKENTNAAEVMDTLFAAKRVGAGEFKDFANYLPQLIAAGSNLGYTFKETAGIFAYFTGKGQDAASSAMLMQNAFSALQKVDIQKGLKKEGINIFDETGKMRDVVSIFTDLGNVMGKMTQEQKTNLLDKVGLRDVQARNAFAILGSDIGKLKDAMEATGNPAGELGAALKNGINPTQEWQIALNKIKTSFIELGTIFLPIVSSGIRILGKLFNGLSSIFSKIVNNGIGQFILKLIGGIGVLIFMIGSVITVMNMWKWMTGQVAQSLIALGKTELAEIFIQKGMAAGFSATAAAAAPLLIELLPLIAIGLAIAGVMYLMSESMSAYQDVLEGTTKPADGFLGVLQKIGGVLSAVREIWASATTEGYTLSEKTAQALENLGIYEFVLNLATWVVRIKAFFVAVWDGVKVVMEQVGKAIRYLVDKFNELALSFGFDISKNLSDINDWIEAGKILGYVIGVVIVGAFISLAISVLAATLPFLLLVAIIFGIIQVFNHWGEITDWVAEKWGQFTDWITSKLLKVGDYITGVFNNIKDAIINAFSQIWSYIVGFIEWYFSLPVMFFDWGISIVNNIFDGIVSSWEWLKSALIGLITELPGGSLILDFFGVGGTVENGRGNNGGSVIQPSVSGNVMSSASVANGQNKLLQYDTGANLQTINTNTLKETVSTVKLYIDGKEVKSRMDKIDKEQNSRK